MKQIGDMKFYDFEDYLEEEYGKEGTQARDAFEHSVDESVHAYRLGEAIKQARLSQNLTQEQLGEKVGVQKSQISRLDGPDFQGNGYPFDLRNGEYRACIALLTIDESKLVNLALCPFVLFKTQLG